LKKKLRSKSVREEDKKSHEEKRGSGDQITPIQAKEVKLLNFGRPDKYVLIPTVFALLTVGSTPG
jgi:hypothetical protein